MAHHPLDSNRWQLHHYATIDSTMDEARRLIDAGSALPLLVTADTQHNGRGRHGRTWTSPPGNFYGTLAQRLDLPKALWAEVSFVLGLAVHASLIRLGVPTVELRLKWPNDILWAGRKIAGILLESGPRDCIIIGIGINLQTHPPQTVFPADNIRHATGLDLAPALLWPVLAEEYATWTRLWQQQGFAPIRQAWLEQAVFLGQPITLRDDHAPAQSGIFHDLAADGALLLRLADGTVKTIFSGLVTPDQP